MPVRYVPQVPPQAEAVCLLPAPEREPVALDPIPETARPRCGADGAKGGRAQKQKLPPSDQVRTLRRVESGRRAAARLRGKRPQPSQNTRSLEPDAPGIRIQLARICLNHDGCRRLICIQTPTVGMTAARMPEESPDGPQAKNPPQRRMWNWSACLTEKRTTNL